MRLPKYLVVVAAFLLPHLCSAKDLVQFRLSKPYCLINFMETCLGSGSTSYTLRTYAKKNGLLDDSVFGRLLADYKSVRYDYTYERSQYPRRRIRSRNASINDLLLIDAVNADNLQQFGEKITGILANDDQKRLLRLLAQAEPYYDTLVWQPNLEKLKTQLLELQQYEGKIAELFTSLAHFYKSSWTADVPFIVTLYPVPGRRGNTTATPHMNSLCVGVMADGENTANTTASIVLHEMCHSLYNEQPAAVQCALDSLFGRDTSRYGSFAYDYFDEGLATACGNGWAYEAFSGKKDHSKWYDDEYINGFGHALYPLVKQYLAEGKAIDSSFIHEAIGLFAAKFPRAPFDYNLLMNSINLYTDAEERSQREVIQAALRKHFRVASMSTSTPVLDETSLSLLESSYGTQVVVIPNGNKAGLTKLKTMFPGLGAMLNGKRDEDFIAAFEDKDRRLVLIISVDSIQSAEKAFNLLDKQIYFDPDRGYNRI